MGIFDTVPTTDEWVESLESLPKVGDLVFSAEAGFETFCAHHPYPWFLFGGEKDDLRRPGDPGSSEVIPPSAPALTSTHRNMLAFGLQKRRRDTSAVVAVGSSPTADVVIPDEMVASQHAIVRESDGAYYLAPGPNARLVSLKLNEVLVSAADPKGVPLRSGDVISLQDIELRYLSPKGMFDLVTELG